MSAREGFGGKMKCTFNVASDLKFGAPTFRATVGKHTAFQLQWAEWESGALASAT